MTTKSYDIDYLERVREFYSKALYSLVNELQLDSFEVIIELDINRLRDKTRVFVVTSKYIADIEYENATPIKIPNEINLKDLKKIRYSLIESWCEVFLALEKKSPKSKKN